MERLRRLVVWELILQYKYGLIAAGFVMSGLWIIVLSLFSKEMIPVVIPLVLLGDLATMGYMFIAAILYFEKNQGSIYAVTTTPVKTKEYIQSKIMGLMLYILGVSLVVVYSIGVIKGLEVHLVYLGLAILCTATFYILLGFILATVFTTFTDFLIPTGIFFLVLFIPALDFLNLPQLMLLRPFYYLFPTHGMLLLMKGIFGNVSMAESIYAVSINLVVAIILYRISLKVFNKKIIGRTDDIDG